MENDSKLFLKQLSEQTILRNNKREDWLKHILTGSTGLFAILVSLHSGKSHNLLTNYVFVVGVALLALGILFGSIALFAGVNALNRFVKEREKQISEGRTSEIEYGTYVEPAKIFYTILQVCYYCFVLAILTLVWYSALIAL